MQWVFGVSGNRLKMQDCFYKLCYVIESYLRLYLLG